MKIPVLTRYDRNHPQFYKNFLWSQSHDSVQKLFEHYENKAGTDRNVLHYLVMENQYGFLLHCLKMKKYNPFATYKGMTPIEQLVMRIKNNGPSFESWWTLKEFIYYAQCYKENHDINHLLDTNRKFKKLKGVVLRLYPDAATLYNTLDFTID